MELKEMPVANAEMLIRRPVDEVFEAFIDPASTTKFWFSKGSGRLEPGKKITWEWEMYGHSAEIDVKAVEKNRRILIEWPGQHGKTTVEWQFQARPDGTTIVGVTNSDLKGSPDDIVKEALDSTGGFSWVLAGLKAYLEHGVILNLVPDRFPDAIVPSWKAKN